MHAEVISIGDEITSGQLLDTNSQWLSLRLEELGVPVLYHTAVGDDLLGDAPEVLTGPHRVGGTRRRPLTRAQAARGRNFGSVTSSSTFTNTTSTGMPTWSASFGQSTTFVCSRGPSSSSTTATL